MHNPWMQDMMPWRLKANNALTQRLKSLPMIFLGLFSFLELQLQTTSLTPLSHCEPEVRWSRLQKTAYAFGM